MTEQFEQAKREFAERWCLKVIECMKEDDYIIHAPDECLSDLTALISENYVSKEAYNVIKEHYQSALATKDIEKDYIDKYYYPIEFVEWLIKDQEIFFGPLTEEYILNDDIHVGGRKLQTIDELFNYWKENEQ